MRAWCLILLPLLALQTGALQVDDEMTKELEEAVQEDLVIVSMRELKPRRRVRGGSITTVESLINFEFPGSQQKVSIQLDRRTKRVLVETEMDGHVNKHHFPDIQTLSESSTVQSLVLAFNQAQPGAHIALYVDCKAHGSVPTPRTLRQMYKHTAPQRLQVSRDRRQKMTIHVDETLETVLDSTGDCKFPPTTPFSRSTRAPPEQPVNDVYTYRRGDIPLIHDIEEKESLLIKTMAELIATVKTLREEIEQQRGETRNLRDVLENCLMCREERNNRRY